MRQLDSALRWARIIGPEGLFMLGFSVLLIGLSGGITLILVGCRILSTARSAPITPEPATIGVVHGKRLQGERIDAEYAARLRRAQALLAAGRVDRIVIVGGSRAGAPVSEAEVGRGFLVACGTPDERILTEQTSRHTLENIRHLRALVGHDARERVVLISSRYHLARCRAMAQNCGLAAQLCAAEARLAVDARLALRLASEAFLLHWYEVGRGLTRLLRYRRASARIA
jgi:uncharacterized SAM-binding protein YcdF (DUF218 family)